MRLLWIIHSVIEEFVLVLKLASSRSVIIERKWFAINYMNMSVPVSEKETLDGFDLIWEDLNFFKMSDVTVFTQDCHNLFDLKSLCWRTIRLKKFCFSTIVSEEIKLCPILYFIWLIFDIWFQNLNILRLWSRKWSMSFTFFLCICETGYFAVNEIRKLGTMCL